MPFLNNIPQPGDNLDFSQPELLTNNAFLDSVFGTDHYPFSNTTANSGFHNTVTTNAYTTTPATGAPNATPPATVSAPKIYAFSPSTNVGVIQFSRGPNNAVPTPITTIQSPVAASVINNNATANMLDFTGLTRAIFIVHAADFVPTVGTLNFTNGIWNGANFLFSTQSGLTLTVVSSGNTLQLKNVSGGTLNNVFWTLTLQRLS